MANDHRVRLVLYWDGEIENGVNGSQYSLSPKRFIAVDDRIKFFELLESLHKIAGIDATRFRIKLFCRYPMSILPHAITYTHIPVEDDDTLKEMLCIPKRSSAICNVELYICKETIPDYISVEDDRSFVPQATYGSFTQLLNSGTGGESLRDPWYHYGAFLTNDMSVHLQRDVEEQSRLRAGPSDNVHVHISIPESSARASENISIPSGNNDMNNHRDLLEYLEENSDEDSFDDDEENYQSGDGRDGNDMSPTNAENMEDEGASIPFYSSIGEKKDSMIDEFDDYRRPVWVDDRTSELEVGMIFRSKEGVQHVVKCSSIRIHRYFKVYESTPRSWFVRCLYYEDQNCLWRVRAKVKKQHGFFEITKMNLSHTCIPVVQPEDHPNLDCGMVGRLVRNHIKDNVSYKVGDVVEDVRSLGVNISYKKAWLGKGKAIEMVFGNWETSYNILPRFLLALQSCNPGTIVEWKHTENSIGDYKMFQSVFWAFKPCIDGFQHCCPVISIDGTFQYGRYKEKILIAVGADAAGHIFPLAFAIVDEETLVNWAWFLYNLKKYVINGRQGICLISDRARGILRAVESDRQLQPPFVHHRFCLRHVKANFSGHFKNNALTELMHRAACAKQIRKFDQIMNSIRELNERAHKWLSDIPLEKWALCYDGGIRYGIMTTNRSESFNSVLKGARKLPITACVRATFYRMVKFFDSNRLEAQDHVAQGNPWPPKVFEKFLKNEHKSKRHRVTAFVREEGLYEVTTGIHGDKGGNVHTVHLIHRTCTCGKFDIYKIPCSHAMKVCEKMGRASLDLVDSVYTSKKMIDTYAANFYPLLHEDYWAPAPFHLVANSARVNDRPGRPRSTRIRNSMDQMGRRPCKACGESGHNRRVCPNIDRLRDRAIRHS